MAVVLEVRSAQGNVNLLRINPGRNRITVRPGDTYRLIDDQTQYAPAGMSVKRADNHVVIDGFDRSAELAANPTVIELSDFYGTCSAATPCQVVIEAAGQVPVTVTPVSSTIGALADGSYVLYDPSYVTPQGTPGVEGSSGLSRPMLYGLGGLAIAGLALAGGGGGGGGGGSAVGSDPGPTDGTLRVTSSSSVNNRKPVITGTGEPGSTVQLQMDLNRDGLADVRYDARVGADGRWSIDLASATPASGSLPAGGISDSTRVLVSANGPAGARSLPLFTLAFDDVAPLPARVDPITLDSVISAPEKQAGIAITGSGEAGGTVSITWGAVQKVVAVGEDGRWSARFATNEIPNDGQSRVEVVSRDAAGNAALPTAADVRVSTGGPVLSITQIGSGNDTTINAAEAANGVQVRGNADPNSQVSVGWNNQTLSALADACGNWAVVFSAAQTPNPSNAEGVNVPLAVRAVNPVGNASDTQINVLVDRVAPSAPAIAVIEGDDRVSQVERGDGVRVGGTTEAGARVAVEWAGVTRTVDADGSGQWAATFSAAEVPAVGAGGASIAATARATDTAGNVGAPAARPVFVEQPFAAPVINPVEGNDLVNAAERADGVVISGTVEAGAPGVNVGWGAFSQTVTPSGTNWSVTVPANLVPADGTQAVQATIAIADGARASREVRIDATPPAAPAIAAVEGDNRITVAEAADGATIAGTAEGGATVVVNWQGTERNVTADGGGRWSADFGVPEVAAGGAATSVTAVAVDTAGNRGPAATSTVFVERPFAAPAINPITGDWVVNLAEASGGVVVSGTHAAGVAGIEVRIGAVAAAATLGAGNSWSTTIAAGQWQAIGDGNTTVVVTNTGAGGGAAAQHALAVDRVPPAVSATVSADNLVLATERNVVVAGTAPGAASVTVQADVGAAQQVAVAADGGWSTTYPTLGPTPGLHLLTVRAVDAAGNATDRQIQYLIQPSNLLSSDGGGPETLSPNLITSDTLTLSSLGFPATSGPPPGADLSASASAMTVIPLAAQADGIAPRSDSTGSLAATSLLDEMSRIQTGF